MTRRRPSAGSEAGLLFARRIIPSGLKSAVTSSQSCRTRVAVGSVLIAEMHRSNLSGSQTSSWSQ